MVCTIMINFYLFMLYLKTQPKVTQTTLLHQMSLRSGELRLIFSCSGDSRLWFSIGCNKCAATFISGCNHEIGWNSEETPFCALFVQLAACFCWFLLRLFLNPNFGEAVFLRNVGLLQITRCYNPEYRIFLWMSVTPTTIRIPGRDVGFILFI
jgi:hypothetical protein